MRLVEQPYDVQFGHRSQPGFMGKRPVRLDPPSDRAPLNRESFVAPAERIHRADVNCVPEFGQRVAVEGMANVCVVKTLDQKKDVHDCSCLAGSMCNSSAAAAAWAPARDLICASAKVAPAARTSPRSEWFPQACGAVAGSFSRTCRMPGRRETAWAAAAGRPDPAGPVTTHS